MTKLLKNLRVRAPSAQLSRAPRLSLAPCLSVSQNLHILPLPLSYVSCMLLFIPELPSHSWPHRCELRLASLESWERGKEGFFPKGHTGNSWRARRGLAWSTFPLDQPLFLRIEHEMHPVSQGPSWAGGVGVCEGMDPLQEAGGQEGAQSLY